LAQYKLLGRPAHWGSSRNGYVKAVVNKVWPPTHVYGNLFIMKRATYKGENNMAAHTEVVRQCSNSHISVKVKKTYN